jgi:DNA-binding MarR family transcriptional regulator
MKIITRSFILNKKEFLTKHFQILSTLGNLNLTDKEIEVITSFLSLDKKIIEEDVFNSLARKLVLEELKISHGSLSNYIKALVTKQLIIKNEITGNIKINPVILPDENLQGYKIKIELE